MGYHITEEMLVAAYPKYLENKTPYDERIQGVRAGFAASFGDRQPRIFSAPGRTEIGGNHTDHQHGCVLAAAIDLDMLGAALPNGTDEICVISEGFAPSRISLADLSVRPEETNTSAALIRGIAAKIIDMGYPVGGLDLYMTCNVMQGSGLSSSAAFEVLLGTVMNGLFCGGALSPVQLAQIGQYAENVYFGKMSGLMDQTASAVGGMVAIDFRDQAQPVVKKLNFDFETSGYSLCILDSGGNHANLSEKYSAIPGEMREIASLLGTEVLREASMELFLERICALREKAGDRAVFRALHFFRENLRAQQEGELLEQGDFAGFLRLVQESGLSSLTYLQNVSVEGSVRNQEVLFALMVCDILLAGAGAYRVHGGGFGGTVQAFVPNAMCEQFRTQAERMLGRGSCHMLSIRHAGGVELTREG